MNTKVLKAAEKSFLKKYPGGFEHPEMVAIAKKHKMEQLEAMAKEVFTKANFKKPERIVEDAAKLVSRSSMISMFEKPKFKDHAMGLNAAGKREFSESLYELLHGKEAQGFERLVDHLKKAKLAKWPLVTVFPAYYRPQKEVFVKPTTAKLIVEGLGLDLRYASTPTWDFYRKFRASIKEMKTKTHKSLAPNNPAYCGFLMTELGKG